MDGYPRKKLDITGNRYGKLEVLSISGKKGVKYYWNCRCDCKRTKAIPENSLRRGIAKSCGMCKLEGEDYIQSKIDILFRNIDKVPSGCWMWTGRLDKNGYGIFPSRRFDQRAHRASYKLLVGEISNGLWVLHNCDVPGCVNPDHLYLGDVKQNVNDAIERGQFPKGPNKKKGFKGVLNSKSKLNETDVKQIRSLGVPNAEMKRWLSACFGLSVSAIERIVRRDTWEHV